MQWRTLRRGSLLLGVMVALTALAAGAAAQSAVALLHVQEAIASTGEGQKLIQQLEAKYQPTQKLLEDKQNHVNSMRDQMQKGANTMSQEAQRNLARDIQVAERELQRDMEDARGEFSQEQSALFVSVGSKMRAIIDSYSKANGYKIVLDISNPNTPVVHAANEVNITRAIIIAYNAAHPVEGATSAE